MAGRASFERRHECRFETQRHRIDPDMNANSAEDNPLKLLVDGAWEEGQGEEWDRMSPVDQTITGRGCYASVEQLDRAMKASRNAFASWRQLPLDDRMQAVQRYAQYLGEHRADIARTITLETGKPLWESDTEVTTSINKVQLSIDALLKRRWTTTEGSGETFSAIRYHPHGTLVVLGPFNLPLHLPGAHFIPALLAGNCVLFKPSEKTPSVGDHIARAMQFAGLPSAVFQSLHGNVELATTAIDHPLTNGVLFTGSYAAGKAIHQRLGGRPEVLLALEMGGNNALIVDQIADNKAAIQTIVQSAWLTSGQRCTCARRLLLVDSPSNRRLLIELIEAAQKVKVGNPLDPEQPFMGTLVSESAATSIVNAEFQQLRNSGKLLLCARSVDNNPAMLTPSIVDMTNAKAIEDSEHFGPLLTVRFVKDLATATEVANATRFGLSAGLLSDDLEAFRYFISRINAGVVNWNSPTTGASGKMPFGGLGSSGNYRPSGYFAADYCSSPIASIEKHHLVASNDIPKGLEALWT